MAKRVKANQLITDPAESARAAGLRYVSDAQPGIHRRRRGKGFGYIDKDGRPIRDAETLGRIKSLVIPPAWSDVWICSNPNGHLQVTGRDAKGRKQSRYHPRWRTVRDETKYERMALFAQALPGIRERVHHDLSLAGMPRNKILATVVRLMELTLIRVGNEAYARENGSYGLTTMRNKHVAVAGCSVTFTFRGKSGIRHSIDLSDRRLARIIQRCQDIPGYELFQYIDDEENHHAIDSADVNEYLQQIAGQDFTAKDFRTWAGTVLAASLLQEFAAAETQTQAKKNVVEAIKQVAARLGNTPSVCRKCYVHPGVLETYFSVRVFKKAKARLAEDGENDPHALRHDELALLQLLKKHAKAA